MSNTSFLDNIQIDSNQLELNKTSFWIFLAASALFIGWVVFITFYLSRIVGLFLSFLLNRALRFYKTPGHVRIGSISISLLGGKLMFRDFVFANNDYSIRCNDGWIIFSYWRSIPSKTIDYQDLTSRLHVSLNGLQLHLYNKSDRYREIARLFNLEKFFPDDCKKVYTVPKAEKSNKWDRIWALVGVIKLDIWSGRLVVGNDRLPYMFALSWENMTSKVRLSESTNDRALLNVEGQMENINGTFYKHSDYQGNTYKEPPRIMNDGFSILSSAHLTFFYRQDILGYVVNEQQTTDKKDRPVWESFWRFGPNTVISYGPWAEQQRALLYSFFFPPDFQNAQVNELPKRGNRRIHIMHDVRVMFLKGSEINIWFMRGQSLESIQSTCQPGSTIDLFVWWITREEGFSWSAKFSLVNVVANTCLNYRKFLQCETLRIETNIHYPRCYNAKQTWTFNYSMEKATAWFTWDHKRFFTDLIDEWIGDAPSDISLFVPYTVATELLITKGFEVILLLNEGNWVDPAEGSSENVECAIVGERLSLAFLLAFDDFLPKTLSVRYSLNGENEMALRLKYPSNSSTAAMLSALMRAARTNSYASRSPHGTVSKSSEEIVVDRPVDSTNPPTASKDKEMWHEVWRTERISCTFDHTYHPISAEFEPLLPRHYLEKWLPKKAPHPKELKPDSLSVKLDFDGSEVMFTGLLIKAIIELKNNYFGYYDSMTDIHDADTDGVNSVSVFNRLGVRPRVEIYRPMDVIVDLRVHNVRAQCLVYSPCCDEPCPVFYTEEIAVEIKKTYHETLIQVGVGPCAAHFEKSPVNQSYGFLTLSSLQFRGHAMFSPVEVPWDMGILEYGWIMEILVGDVTGSLEIPNHLASLHQILESLLLFVLSKDDEKKAPARFNVCQHGQLVTYCSKSSLPKNICEGEERLKYRALRLAVDGVKLSLCEEKTVTELSIDPIRFTLCNGHDGKYTENISIRVPFLQIRHVFVLDQSGNGLEVACIGINGININLELPHPGGDLLSNARCDFMRKHDRETKRLAFLWTDTAIWCCACYGATKFFGADDVIGKDFLSIKKDGMRKICVPNITSSGQPGVLQDLLKPDEFMLHHERHNFYPPKIVCQEAKVVTPVIASADSSSFHSAVSQQKDNRLTNSGILMKEYGKYLTHVEVIRPQYEAPRFVVPGAIGAWIENKVVLLKRVLVGLDTVRMNAEHNKSQMSISRQVLASARQSSVSLITNNKLVIQGSVANSVELFVCPVALDCAERITNSIISWFRDIHPGFLIQMRYRDCVLGNHRQPLTSSLFPTAPSKISLDVSLKLPKFHLSLFQCGQLDHLGTHQSDTDSDRIQPMSSNMVFVVLDGANFNTNVDNGSNSNIYALQSSSISSQLVQFIPATSADFATNTAKSTFKSTVQWKDSLSSSRTELSPRVVVDFFIPDVVVSLQQKDASSNSVHPSPNSNQRRNSSTQPLRNLTQETAIKVEVGEMTATIVMARALEHTSKYEFPIYDVLSPGITTWLTVAYRLNIAIDKLQETWNSWKDLTVARVMKYAFECTDERIFGGLAQKNLMDSVKILGKHQASCPSCKLLMILMRWCSLSSSSDIIVRPVSTSTALTSEKDRKSAILALLKHWQPDISELVKLSCPEDVVRFSSDAELKCKEVKINIEQPEAIDKDARPLRHRRTGSAVSNRNLPRDGNVKRESDVDAKNDLYRWIASAHKERHEKKEGKKRGESVNKDGNPLLDIVPHAFFYALYRAHRLDWTNLDNVPFDSFKITYEFTVSGLVAELIEPKLMPSSHGSILLAAHHPHRLMVVKKVVLSGDLTWLIEMDEKDLMPVRGRATLNYTGITSRVQFGVVMPSFCVAKELILVGKTAGDTISELQKDVQCLLTPSSNRSVTTAKTATDKLRWDEHLLEMAREYEKSSKRDNKSRRGDVISRVRGQFTIEDVCLESRLTDLYVSFDVKNIDLTQDHTPPEHSPNSLNVSSDLDKLNVKLRKARLDIRESVSDFRTVNRASVNESKTILQCSLKESSATLARKLTLLAENQTKIDTSLSVLLGVIEGELPMAAHSLHEVVLRHGPQLEQQLDRLSAQPQSVLSPMHPGSHPGTSEAMEMNEIDTTYKRPSARRELSLTRNAPIAQIAFSFAIQKVALKACLLPSLTAKYVMNQAISKGVTGSEANWSASIEDHSAKFHITAQKTPDTFELALPSVSVNGQYLTEEKEVTNGAPNTDKQLHYRKGGFLKMVVTLGQVNHSFTTELLNHILFAEQTFRSELSSLVQRLNKERDRPSLLSPVVTSPVPVTEKPSLLFFLTVKGTGIPWLQLTAATPTNTAVRFTIDSLEMELTNRWVVKDEDSSRERIFGAAVIQFNAKLGQLVKPAQYEEIQAELQEYATFMTQIRMENKESSREDSYSYLISLNRPILLIKSTAIDKAILLWLNYKNTYDYWRAERSRYERSTQKRQSISHTLFPPQPTQDVNINLSLSINNGFYVCMPLIGNDITEGMPALVLSLQKSDVTITIKKELACQAQFHGFKLRFIDNFDEQALSNFNQSIAGEIESNYFFFPQGSYKLCSKATNETGDAKWVLSVRSHMRGMVIDLDQRIGKFGKMLVNTFASLGEEDGEFYEESSIPATSMNDSDLGTQEHAELRKLPADGRIPWMERKLHEQSRLVSDLMARKANEKIIEIERKKLRQFEMIRFKEFSRSMVDKIRRRNDRREGKRSNTVSDVPPSPFEPKPAPVTRTESDVDARTAHSSSSAANANLGKAQDSVSMHIDVQVNIESGTCTLRSVPKQDPSTTLVKRPSAKDLLRSKPMLAQPSSCTKFSIPSVDLKGLYTSPGSEAISPVPDFHHPTFTLSDNSRKQFIKTSKRACFYLSVSLSSMPSETVITPHLADYLEQVLEPLPVSMGVRSESVTSVADPSEPMTNNIVVMDTSVLPIDVLIYFIVQSSTIRFDGQQQRSSAADCQLKLPSLSLVASTRTDGGEYLGGIDISIRLDKFSLSIYSPHQASTSYDALSLALDHLALVISRSKNSSCDNDNRVRFVLTSNIGTANFKYDMRRLNELMAFPKPWYRRAIARRIFFGDQSAPAAPPSASGPTLSRQSTTTSQATHRKTDNMLTDKPWSATVLLSAQWKELKIEAQMSNTMGKTNLIARKGVLRGRGKLNSKHERNITTQFKLDSSELTSHGGVISGDIFLNRFEARLTHSRSLVGPPTNKLQVSLNSIATRMEWMSRAVLIAKCEKPSITLGDEFSEVKDENGEVIRVSVALNVKGTWDDLQVVINRNTVEDFGKMVDKLKKFFTEQLSSSLKAWTFVDEALAAEQNVEDESSEEVSGMDLITKHWEGLLDTITDIQFKFAHIIAYPKRGETVVGGSVELEAGRLSLACMHGEMNATSWALFHMNTPSILFSPEAQFCYVADDKSRLGVSVKQQLIIGLGRQTKYSKPSEAESMASVCRVVQGRNSVMRQNASISASLEFLIGDALKKISLDHAAHKSGNVATSSTTSQAPSSSNPAHPNKPQHEVLELFQFPALEAVLTSLQTNECLEDDKKSSDTPPPEVHLSFHCDFHSSVYLQTDFTAQATFLPELLKSYIHINDTTEPSKDTDLSRKSDKRLFKCDIWTVNPSIRFIGGVKFTPPLIDDILRKLQIFDHRTTIPKALQRALLDPMDASLCIGMQHMLRFVEQGEQDRFMEELSKEK